MIAGFFEVPCPKELEALSDYNTKALTVVKEAGILVAVEQCKDDLIKLRKYFMREKKDCSLNS